ncbi:MAG: Undecaprenyl-phosphate 4-deoxy-4-formamido-L-arabinose transferase [Actinobacteria bacterium ADurb.Bin346]|nr:MAG: Undecaprenyl-phosphate 4-deoxy-4-formamido-L-arabinose transferase [Actinobacteria bacterium ADurb.Bin346]
MAKKNTDMKSLQIKTGGFANSINNTLKKCSGDDKVQPYISIVVPVYNEEESLELLYDKLSKVMEKIGKPYEVILVDDGSRDNSFKKLSEIHLKNPNFKIIKFRRNFGQTQAMRAGFEYSSGEIVITLDADLQNDPEDIPSVLAKMEEGYDIVSGWRKNRKDKALSRKLPSRIANRMISKLFNVHLHDYGCTLKAYRKDVLANIELYGEMHRYIPAVSSWMGVNVAEIPVSHHPRKYGKAKYGISRTIRVILDMITIKFLLTYSKKPMQMFGLAGGFISFIGAGLVIWMLVERLFFAQPLSTRPLFIMAIFIFLVGFQLITMGLLGEIMMRTYHEGTGKPTYVIKEILDE